MSELDLILTGRRKDLGGFSVSRVLPAAKRRRVGPFVFLDEMGPAVFEPGKGVDVRSHPHVGLATLTYLFEGEMDHADSLGVHQTATPGAVNLMAAGRGIVHSERTGPRARAAGHALHGIQAWIALPDEAEEMAPEFHHYDAEDIPAFERGGAHLRLIMGSAYEHRSPVKTFSPMVYLHAEAPAGAAIDLPRGHGELAAYVVSGQIETGGEPVSAGHMAVFGAGEAPVIRARADSRLMILGGANIGERHIDWNFVSSSKARIEQARTDWRASIAGGFKDTPFALPPGEHEWIALPGDPDTGAPPEQTEDCPTS
jgi:redox-sensitive bicupin YhaK (pirin superfamily)